MRRFTFGIISIALALTVFVGCAARKGSAPQQTEKAQARSIFVLCGAGLRQPMEEISRVFEGKTGVKVNCTYAGSACLLAQIDSAQQGDCYMPGEGFYMEQAQEKGYLTDMRQVAYVIPVIAVAKGNPKHVRGLEDLTRKDLRVGLCDPHATALGKQAYTVLEKAGLIEKVMSNLATSAATVPELGNGIKLGHLDAAIVWDAVALWYPEDIDIIPIDPKYNEVSTVPLGILKFCRDPEVARQFFDFVSSAEGKAIFKKHGYSLTPTSQYHQQEAESGTGG
jgi:molybdate transport system substrate-binding protein